MFDTYFVEVVHTCTGCEVDDEMRAAILFCFEFNDSAKLDQLL